MYDWFRSLIIFAVEDLILDIFDKWEDELIAYSGSDERFLRGPPYQDGMVECILSLQPPGHPRPSFAPFGPLSLSLDKTAANPLALAVPPPASVGDATMHQSRRSRPAVGSRNRKASGTGLHYRYNIGERQNTESYHDDGTDSDFRSVRRRPNGGYSERRNMDARDYPPAGGMFYKDFHAAVSSFRKMYYRDAEEWIVNEAIPFVERPKKVDHREQYFSNVMRSYVGIRASREQNICLLLMSGAISSKTLNTLNGWGVGVGDPDDLHVEYYWEYLATNMGAP